MLYPDARETIAALRERGIRIAVVSNFDSRLITILEGLGVASSFEDIFVSSSVGYAKPDRRIFDFVLKAWQLTPEHVLHVGDSLKNDVEGAGNAGIKSILVDRKGAHHGAALTRVASLSEILDRLE